MKSEYKFISDSVSCKRLIYQVILHVHNIYRSKLSLECYVLSNIVFDYKFQRRAEHSSCKQCICGGNVQNPLNNRWSGLAARAFSER